MNRRFVIFGALALAGCGASEAPPALAAYDAPLYPNETPALRALIVEYANLYDVPVDLVQRVVVRESTHRPSARNGPYYGLMQILPQTARTMGAETNLRYAVRYLRGAWMVSDGNMDRAVMWYARGYYYEAKRRGLLRETGLRS